MSHLFAYSSLDFTKNFGLILKGVADKPSVFIDFADGLISSSTTLTTIGATALSTTGSTVTGTIVGTTGISGTVARVDLRTGGSNGTGDATDGDRYQITVTATPSTGGPLIFLAFVEIDQATYGPA